MRDFTFGGQSLASFGGRILQAPSHTVAKRNKTFLENRHTGKVSTFEKKYKLIIEEYRRQGKSIPEIMKLIGDEATLEKVKGVIYRNNIPKGK